MTNHPPKVWTRKIPFADHPYPERKDIYFVCWFDGVTFWRGTSDSELKAARGLDWMLHTCDLW